uniref:MROH2B-like HEAT-repeats domain-containing protein n=1 Tax=Paramoeba aestuarina TaxID=180227 RepID=A0A7S4UHK8_9EUKA
MFEFVVDPKYTPAAGILAKAIAALGSRKREEWESGEADDEKKDFYLIDFEKHVNLPTTHALIARWFVLATTALRRNKQGENVLEALRACGPLLHEEVAALWDNALVKLVVFIQNKQDNWVQQKWEDLILRLLAETIKLIDNDAWTTKIGEALAEQLPSYKDDPELKANALKQLGLVLQKLSHKAFINNQLELMFKSTNHANDAERLGCAQG